MAQQHVDHPPFHVPPSFPFRNMNPRQLWRLLLIALLPFLVWLTYALMYDRHPQRAGDLTFDIVVNHFSNTACLDFHDSPAPDALAEFNCSK